MDEIEVLSPVAETRAPRRDLSRRPDALSGLRVGWLNNRKANAADLLSGLEASMREAGGEFESLKQAKDPTAAAPEAVMAHLKTCDAVVLAIAD